ncbi:MarR family winged helix-turn-helix transcriptional regulator [Cellulosimicrobium cellulans]|uniref:MarR family winged helix-turn-helix transcriptional regulator n=1 Tax=Cellulosimicrobium cellulans TaxID=1710 RepID=UPI003830EA56
MSKSPSDATIVEAIGQLAFEAMAVLTRIAGEQDLSLTQLRVLGILRDRRLKMVELAAYLGLEKSTMTGLVARAEHRGLMRRSPNPDDRRAVDVTLTESGRRLVDTHYGDFVRALDPLVSRLDQADRDQLEQLVRRMLGTLQP